MLFIHDQVKAERIINALAAHGENVIIHQPAFLSGLDRVRIGDRVVINAFAHIWGEGGVMIGNDCLIASHCVITSLTHNAGTAIFSQENIAAPVRIGNNVWIGAHAIILPGVTIGDNVIIGAGALVNCDIPAGTAYAGVPAKKLYDLKQFDKGAGL